MDSERTYIAIDLKSFYASVECVDRGLDPLTTNLVVADASRTNKTICLAVSPALKAYGIGGRPRLFEVERKVREVNNASPGLNLSYIIAPPRMSHYLEVSSKVYETYLKYVAPEDIHVYSIDEVFIDITSYLPSYRMSARQLTVKMIRDVLATTGITATAGIGTNLYLCKVAMDIMAKKAQPDKTGVRIAELDEMTYRRKLWDHRPITDFWRVGHGIAQKLALHGIDTMGRLARMSVRNEELLYRLFGVNAELLIDHAWGWEPCTIDYIKAYRPESNSLSSGQVLQSPYSSRKARVVVQEMADQTTLELVAKRLVTSQVVLTVSYDRESLTIPEIRDKYHGEVTIDHYGRAVPKHAHGTANFDQPTSSSREIIRTVMQLYDRIVNKDLLIRRLNLTVNHVVSEDRVKKKNTPLQPDLFTDYQKSEQQLQAKQEAIEKERRLQEARIAIKRKFGKNAILKGLNFAEGATAMERNKQIGGHKA